jgi:hypothetical protein
LFRTGDFFEDFARRFGPDEGLWVGKKRQKQIEQPATRASQIKVPSVATGLEPRAKEWMALPGLEEEPDKDVIELF